MANAEEILQLLETQRNVLLSGPPGTGKSTLLNEVAALFENQIPRGTPRFDPSSPIPIPQATGSRTSVGSTGDTNRKVFRSVLHQSSKYRDFLTGIMPDVRPGALPGKFQITEGVLYCASEYAKQDNHAALLIIDEINRGPTVQVFGGAIVAIEGEKRLAEDGTPAKATQFFELLNPVDGELVEYAFPSRLYILAAMNQADVSVEPLDVAFLRRWTPVLLEPSDEILRTHFGLSRDNNAELPQAPSSTYDVYEAAVRAFNSLNERIALGRGPEFRIGHGMLMTHNTLPSSINEALDQIAIAWRIMKNHIDEAFFGDIRGTATILNADMGIPNNPYSLEEKYFGDTPRATISGPQLIGSNQVYDLLLALAKVDS